MEVRINDEWKALLKGEFDELYFEHLTRFVRQAYQRGEVYPPASLIFRAFDSCPVSRVRVVILGQDPYHNPGQAEGLAFSVPEGVSTPPSLVNMLKEVADDTGQKSVIQGGHLHPWIDQGVFLLNATLTVAAHQPGSHQGQGWETFTDRTIAALSAARKGLVFMLWGSYARRKAGLIDRQRHLILEAPHPSPLSAYRGFMGCKHFSQANNYLTQQGYEPIVW